jgi:nucleotide-binding universal stress UspA family protein
MKKIVLVFDGTHFSEGSFRMASFLNELEPSLVTGVFLQPIDYRDIVGYTGVGNASPITISPYHTDEEVMKKNIKLFESKCQHAGIEYRTHKDTDLFALEELQTETRFADLMILSSELFYENIGKDQPNEYLKKVLRQTECPILLVPENYNLPNKLLLAYDGKPDSVFAIKQFTYLFPQLNNWETKLITLEDEEEPLPHQELIEELAAKHFSNLTLEVVSSETAASFANWMAEQDDYLLVAGAYGRSELSNLFKKSFLAEVIEQHKTPIFVAHK